jgi:cobalt-zinc-cadmium efflux system protein
VTRTRRLTLVVALNLLLVVGQTLAGLAAHSTGLLADAGHNFTDVAGVTASLLTARWALHPRDATHSFGYHRGTILAALANSVAITTITLLIAIEGIRRLLHPEAVRGEIVIVTAAGALLLNAIAAAIAHEKNHGADLNMRSVLLHMTSDAAASLVVLASGVLLATVHSITWVDPTASLVVGVIIVTEAWSILRSSIEILLESSPSDLDLGELEMVIHEVPGVTDIHDLHVWSLSSDIRALSAHLVLAGHPTLEEAQRVGDQVKKAIAEPFAIAHTTLELECERCVEEQEDPCLMDPHDSETPRTRRSPE